MALGDLFASTRNRSPLQTPPLGQLPGFITGSPARALGLPEGDEEHDPDERRLIEHPIDTGDDGRKAGFTIPGFGEIPRNVQDLLALFDLDPDTPGIQGPTGQLAGMSAEQIAVFFDLDPAESAKFFQPVNTGQLQASLTDIGTEQTFGFGEARRKVGVQTAGIRSGLLGLANLARQRQATSGFAGAGAPGTVLRAGRREAGRAASNIFGAFGAEKFGVQKQARSGIEDLLDKISGIVRGYGLTAADLVAGGAKRFTEDETNGGISDIPEDSTGFPVAFTRWLLSRGVNPENATQSDWERFIGRTRPRGGRE